jgi:small GTP-binding protein
LPHISLEIQRARDWRRHGAFWIVLTASLAEDSYSVTRTIDGTNYLLMLTDTAGQEEYRGLWAASNLKSDAFLLVYDITNPHSLDALEYFMEMIDMEEDGRIDSGSVPPVKMVVGNKCDLSGNRQVGSKQGLDWARQRRCGFMETSAREMVNIEETFARKTRETTGEQEKLLTAYRTCATCCRG